ncbi:MAG: hypothetical protein ACOYBQ_06690 [Fluviibacter sp.]
MKRYSRQHGVGVLPVALILLAGAALMLLFTQRNLLTDLRITQNGYGHRLAYAAADAGLATTLSQLNDPVQRSRILADQKGAGAYDLIQMPVLQVPLGDALSATVSIKGLKLGGSDIRLQLQSTGCVAGCDQGRATVSQTLAMRGGIHRLPRRPITTRAEVAPQMSPDTFFQHWFGADKAYIQSVAKQLRCDGDCNTAIAAAGSQVVWLAGNARLSSGTLGTPSAPVVIIASGQLALSNAVRITGVVYSMAPITQVQTSLGRVDGALIAENSLNIEDTSTVSYNPIVLQTAQSKLGVFIPVPGSWSDGE